MRTAYEERTGEANEIARKILRGTEKIFGPKKITVAWKAVCQMQGLKPAEEMASRIGCTVRAAEYQLSGQSRACGKMLAAVIAELMSDQ